MSKVFTPCLIFLQLFLWETAAASRLEEGRIFTQYVWQTPKTMRLSSLKATRGRGPASAIPRDDIEPVPLENEMWINEVFVEDRAGVMNRMRNQFAEWDRIEEYRRQWDIGSTGLYETPDRERKKAWFNRMLLRYADKRLSGELKEAEEGSTLRKVRSVKKALKPDTEAKISNNIKIKFKARVLRMRGIMRVINPWVESETTFNARGEVNSRLSKNFKDLGIRTDINYQVTEGVYNANISKPLGNNITAVLSSSQSHSEVAFSDLDRTTIQFFYSTPF